VTVGTAEGAKQVACRVQNLSKRFPGVDALKDINMEIATGEVHGLIGKNGAGKSTLVNILAGYVPFTEGEILIRGEEMGRHYWPRKAEEMGLFLVPQNPLILNGRNVIENLFVGQQVQNGIGFTNEKEMRRKTEKIIQRLGLSVSPDQDMSALSLDTQKLLLLGKGVYIAEASILMLDEITAALGVDKRKVLLDIIQEIKDKHKSIIFISHIMKEILQFCDKVTVLRNGRTVLTESVSATSESKLSEAIVGTDFIIYESTGSDIRKQKEANPVLLSCHDLFKRAEYQGISFELRKNEVLGFAGLQGCGKDELFRTLFGLDQPDSGQVTVQGRVASIKNPSEAIKLGIVYLSDRRETEGLYHGLTIEENLLQLAYKRLRNAFGMLQRRKTRTAAQRFVDDLKIKITSLDAEIDSLSGGNKQKVILARTMSMAPRVYILNEPTQGIDVGTKQEILRSIRESLSQNAGVLVSSESVQELMVICDRIIVFFKGKQTREFARVEFEEETIYKAVQGIGTGDFHANN
jgi:ABC-type sugar transport system ATPase subunit